MNFIFVAYVDPFVDPRFMHLGIYTGKVAFVPLAVRWSRWFLLWEVFYLFR